MKQVIDPRTERLDRKIKLLAGGPEPLCAYLYDLTELRRHARRLMAALPSFCELFYALKANSEAPFAGALAGIVHGYEAASAGEVRIARSLSSQLPVVFGGPVKTDAALEEALSLGVRHIHVESRHELIRLSLIAQRSGMVVPVLLRVNVSGTLPDATLFMAGGQTQFGIDEQLVPEVIEEALLLKGIRLDGFHFHSVSNNLNEERHLELVRHYCGLVKAWATRFGLEIRYVNSGGGIGVNYADLTRQFDWERFAEGLDKRIRPLMPDGAKLMFECGRFIAASSGAYAAEVVDVKSSHGNDFVLLRGGTHHFRLPASWGHSHPFRIVPIDSWSYPYARPEHVSTHVTVVGELCTPKDRLAKEAFIERVRVGDVLLFPYAGAYGWAISHREFLSHPHPLHLYADDNGWLGTKQELEEENAK